MRLPLVHMHHCTPAQGCSGTENRAGCAQQHRISPITCTVLQGDVCLLALCTGSTQAMFEAVGLETQTCEKEKPV